jgi:hypothetical protein
MPHVQYEALEACCQAQRERGIDSDESTVKDKDDNEDAVDAGDPHGEPALIKSRICKEPVNMFKRVLLFSQGVAVAL